MPGPQRRNGGPCRRGVGHGRGRAAGLGEEEVAADGDSGLVAQLDAVQAAAHSDAQRGHPQGELTGTARAGRRGRRGGGGVLQGVGRILQVDHLLRARISRGREMPTEEREGRSGGGRRLLRERRKEEGCNGRGVKQTRLSYSGSLL